MFIFSFFAPTANTSSELKLVNTKGISQNSCDRQFYQHHKHWLKIITGIGNRLLVGLETFRCSTWDRHLSANLTNGTTFCDPDLIVFFGGIFVHCKIHWCYEILWPAEHFDVALISCQYLKLVNNYLQKPKKKKTNTFFSVFSWFVTDEKNHLGVKDVKLFRHYSVRDQLRMGGRWESQYPPNM